MLSNRPHVGYWKEDQQSSNAVELFYSALINRHSREQVRLQP